MLRVKCTYSALGLSSSIPTPSHVSIAVEQCYIQLGYLPTQNLHMIYVGMYVCTSFIAMIPSCRIQVQNMYQERRAGKGVSRRWNIISTIL